MIKLTLGKLQYVKTRRNSISKFHFPVELYEIRKKCHDKIVYYIKI